MQINWFPGHMKKTLDALQKDINNIDVVMYVLDARAWFSCLNPKIDEIVQHKKIIYLINKCDLISNEDKKDILEYFVKQNKTAICLQGTSSSSRNILISALKEATRDKYEKSKAKGVEPIFKVMVLGTPNTGKSTIINTLCGKKKTMTGDKAGVTKGNQWVRISDNFALLDTPVTLWPKMDSDEVKLKLAFIGGIKKDVVDEEELGFELIKYMIKSEPDYLKARYSVDNFDREPIEVYDDIMRRIGVIIRGGDIDYTRGGIKVLEDFRSGRMGKICLDKLSK